MSTTSKPITMRQLQCLHLIVGDILRGCPPSIRELARKMGINSACGVYLHLRGLRDRGLITFDETPAGRKTVRSIRLNGASLKLAFEPNETGQRLRQVIRMARNIQRGSV